jgi:hypothetical protein
MYRSRYRYQEPKPKHEYRDTAQEVVERLFVPESDEPVVPYDVRKRHIYVIGKTQHGKSTLLYDIISTDIKNGAGVCVLDPKPSAISTNLAETVLQHIPPDRENDVLFFNAKDPLPLDVMSWETEEERQWVEGDLMKTFMQFLTQKEGDRWPNVLRYIIKTMLAIRSTNYLDIYDFCIDEVKRSQLLKRLDPSHHAPLITWWEKYPTLGFPKDTMLPIIIRMTSAVLIPPISKMLGPADRRLNIEDVIRQRKILLVDLSSAGDEVGQFIGILLVSRIQQAVFRRLKTPFHLFADEFQNFQTSAFDKILSESASLGLRLTLANQYIGQIDDRIRQSIFGNVSTFFVFNIDDADTRYFKSKMPVGARHEYLACQAPFHALYAIAGRQPELRKIPAPPPPPTAEELKRAECIKNRTLSGYPSKPPEQTHNSDSAKSDPPTSHGRDHPSRQGIPPPHAQASSGNPQHRQQNRPAPRTKKSEPPLSSGKN